MLVVLHQTVGSKGSLEVVPTLLLLVEEFVLVIVNSVAHASLSGERSLNRLSSSEKGRRHHASVCFSKSQSCQIGRQPLGKAGKCPRRSQGCSGPW